MTGVTTRQFSKIPTKSHVTPDCGDEQNLAGPYLSIRRLAFDRLYFILSQRPTATHLVIGLVVG